MVMVLADNNDAVKILSINVSCSRVIYNSFFSLASVILINIYIYLYV